VTATLIHSGHVAAEAAADHAERETPDWATRAAEIFMEFANQAGGEFQTEQVREYAAKQGFPSPPDPRAWGHIATSLRRAGRIVFITNRSTQSKTCNSHPRAVWKATAARVLKTDLFE
jgi:hypothetical protein